MIFISMDNNQAYFSFQAVVNFTLIFWWFIRIFAPHSNPVL